MNLSANALQSSALSSIFKLHKTRSKFSVFQHFASKDYKIIVYDPNFKKRKKTREGNADFVEDVNLSDNACKASAFPSIFKLIRAQCISSSSQPSKGRFSTEKFKKKLNVYIEHLYDYSKEHMQFRLHLTPVLARFHSKRIGESVFNNNQIDTFYILAV